MASPKAEFFQSHKKNYGDSDDLTIVTWNNRAQPGVTQRCLEILGGLGISRDYLPEKWFRDSRITDIYEGTGQIVTAMAQAG